MKTGVIVLVVVAVLALLVGGAYVSSRNQMVTKNEAVKSAWAEVDVVLQRRADLIPNLAQKLPRTKLPRTANWTERSAACW